MSALEEQEIRPHKYCHSMEYSSAVSGLPDRATIQQHIMTHYARLIPGITFTNLRSYVSLHFAWSDDQDATLVYPVTLFGFERCHSLHCLALPA